MFGFTWRKEVESPSPPVAPHQHPLWAVHSSHSSSVLNHWPLGMRAQATLSSLLLSVVLLCTIIAFPEHFLFLFHLWAPWGHWLLCIYLFQGPVPQALLQGDLWLVVVFSLTF